MTRPLCQGWCAAGHLPHHGVTVSRWFVRAHPVHSAITELIDRPTKFGLFRVCCFPGRGGGLKCILMEYNRHMRIQ